MHEYRSSNSELPQNSLQDFSASQQPQDAPYAHSRSPQPLQDVNHFLVKQQPEHEPVGCVTTAVDSDTALIDTAETAPVVTTFGDSATATVESVPITVLDPDTAPVVVTVINLLHPTTVLPLVLASASANQCRKSHMPGTLSALFKELRVGRSALAHSPSPPMERPSTTPPLPEPSSSSSSTPPLPALAGIPRPDSPAPPPLSTCGGSTPPPPQTGGASSTPPHVPRGSTVPRLPKDKSSVSSGFASYVPASPPTLSDYYYKKGTGRLTPPLAMEIYYTVPSKKTSAAPVVITPEPENVWRGIIIHMPDVAKFSASPFEVSGKAKFLPNDVPGMIEAVGRIAPHMVWSYYIAQLKKSGSQELLVVRFQPANEEEEKVSYIALYSYLSSKKRYAVIGNCGKSVKDFYVVLLASHQTICSRESNARYQKSGIKGSKSGGFQGETQGCYSKRPSKGSVQRNRKANRGLMTKSRQEKVVSCIPPVLLPEPLTSRCYWQPQVVKEGKAERNVPESSPFLQKTDNKSCVKGGSGTTTRGVVEFGNKGKLASYSEISSLAKSSPVSCEAKLDGDNEVEVDPAHFKKTHCKTWAEEVDEAYPIPDDCIQYFPTNSQLWRKMLLTHYPEVDSEVETSASHESRRDVLITSGEGIDNKITQPVTAHDENTEDDGGEVMESIAAVSPPHFKETNCKTWA